ncbi:RNA 3'-terminal phosphate cyclase [Candidatus Bathyarchaeota archaeon]|nr:RNA 3'-terminal phosphate cyclase [Candidatus Bathyarchaeota archaeon]
MLEIDGSQKSGSGTILRLSVALAGITGEPLHIFNVRKRRSEPGLRPQHLESVLTAAKICDATVKGAFLGSQELWFEPKKVRGGQVTAEIGTAGSIPMLILTVLPLCMFASQPVDLLITKGGTDVSHSPTINYLRFILLPLLEKMGAKASIEVNKYGYYPKGMGEITLTVHPHKEMFSLRMMEFGILEEVHGISVCTFLKDRRVADRQAETATRIFEAKGLKTDIEVVYDESNRQQKGSSLALWALTDKGCIIGADAIGEIGKSSEAVGDEAARNLLAELDSKATVDVHLADMLVPYVALAKGDSVYLTRSLTEHLETNILLTQEILGTEFRIEKTSDLYQVSSRGC